MNLQISSGLQTPIEVYLSSKQLFGVLSLFWFHFSCEIRKLVGSGGLLRSLHSNSFCCISSGVQFISRRKFVSAKTLLFFPSSRPPRISFMQGGKSSSGTLFSHLTIFFFTAGISFFWPAFQSSASVSSCEASPLAPKKSGWFPARTFSNSAFFGEKFPISLLLIGTETSHVFSLKL